MEEEPGPLGSSPSSTTPLLSDHEQIVIPLVFELQELEQPAEKILEAIKKGLKRLTSVWLSNDGLMMGQAVRSKTSV